jgi:hypothetical protein
MFGKKSFIFNIRKQRELYERIFKSEKPRIFINFMRLKSDIFSLGQEKGSDVRGA